MSPDVLFLSFAAEAVAPACVRLGWRRRTVRGLSLHDILTLAARYPDSRETVLGCLGLSRCDDPGITADGGAALVDLVATALGSRTFWMGRRIASLPADDLAALLRQIRSLTIPPDVGAFFETHPSTAGEDEEEFDDSLKDEPIFHLGKKALLLAAKADLTDPLSLTPGQVIFLDMVLSEDAAAQSARDVVRQASAGQAAKIDDNSKWQAWVAKNLKG